MEEKLTLLDFFDPAFIIVAILTIGSDFLFLFSIGSLIPVVGQVLLLGILAIHYAVAIILALICLPRLQHFLPKIILWGSLILPLPFLSLGLFLAILTQNRVVEFLVTQAAIQGVAAATGGAGEVLEGAVVAERGAQAVEGVTAAGQGVTLERGRKALGTVQDLGGAVAEERREQKGAVSEEAFGISESTDKTRELFEFEDDEIRKGRAEEREAAEELYRETNEGRIQEMEEKEEALTERISPGTEQLNRLRDLKEVSETLEKPVEINEEENSVNLKEAA